MPFVRYRKLPCALSLIEKMYSVEIDTEYAQDKCETTFLHLAVKARFYAQKEQIPASQRNELLGCHFSPPDSCQTRCRECYLKNGGRW